MSNFEMEIDLEKAEKPVRKLRKLLKRLSPDLKPEDVHELRTQARRIEALLHALTPKSRGQSRRLVKLLKPLRKAAGRVRDMDVLVANASSLSSRVSPDELVRLIEHIAVSRTDDSRRFYRIARRNRKKTRSALKRFQGKLRRASADKSPGLPVSAAPQQALTEHLAHWPRLQAGNLHDFRKGIKELRYRTQLQADHPDKKGMEAFAMVKDAIGDWHDWLELQKFAESVLDPKRDAEVLRAIGQVLREKLRSALTTANQLRRKGKGMPLTA